MSTHKEFMKAGGVKEIYAGRLSNDPQKEGKVIAKGVADNVKFNEHGYANEQMLKAKGNEGR